MPIARYLEWFDYHTDAFVGRIALELTLEELQALFIVKADDPMYDCWEVKSIHVGHLQARTGQIIDLNRFAYFVSAEST